MGIPVVSTLHTIGTEPRFFGPKTDRAETLSLRYGVSKLIACGPAVAEAFQLKLKKKSIQVIPNATVLTTLNLAQEERIKVRSEIMGNPERTMIISVGRLVVPKAFHDLLNAFAIVHLQQPEAFLVIVGAGELYSQLANQIKDLNLTGHAALLGSRNDVPRLLASSDVFVLSSQWEGLPVVILEAMGAALPIIATNVGDVAWAIGPAGLIVPPSQPDMLANAMLNLLGEPALQHTLGEGGRARAEDLFGAKRWFDQIFVVYRDLLASRTWR
jgi:glycosyltransferase involved in cell wall biosynthesis